MFTREQIIEAAIRAGFDAVATEQLMDALNIQSKQQSTVTIICNDGVHPIHKEQLPGRVYAATTGNIPDQTAEALQRAIADACGQVARLIKDEGPFSEIFLLPSGYGVLLQKLAETIFQITGQPAITLHFDRKTSSYWPIRLDLRPIITGA